MDDRLGEDRCRRGAVTGHVIGLRRRFLEELRAHVFERIRKFDFLGDGHTVMTHRRCAVLLVNGDIPAFRAECRLDRFRQGVHALLQLSPGIRIESQLLRHGSSSYRYQVPLLRGCGR